MSSVPGLTLTSPMKSPELVLVNVELARATKFAAEPRLGAIAPRLVKLPWSTPVFWAA